MSARGSVLLVRRAYGPGMVETAWATKLARAREHIVALTGEIHGLQDRGELRIAIERDGTDHVLRAIVPDPMPARISAIIGDALHNTRSALDLFASALWPHRIGRDLTEAEEERVTFPLTAHPDGFAKWLKRRIDQGVPALDGDATDHLRRVQPWYFDAQAAEHGLEPRWPDRRHDTLLRLQDLNNHDKHRRLAVVAVWPDTLAVGHSSELAVGWRPGRERLGNGIEIGRWILPAEEPDMDLEHMGDLQLVLEQIAGAGQPVAEDLGAMARQVELVLHQLAPLMS